MEQMEKSVAILGFNIFSPGGTTRSNLNIIHDFLAEGYQVDYYNFRDFSRLDILKLTKENQFLEKTNFHEIKDIKQEFSGHFVFITRESFFPIAKYIRYNYPDKVIIGEMHTPLGLTNREEWVPNLNYFNFIRVATKSIQDIIRNEYHFERTYVQTISLSHLENEASSNFKASRRDVYGKANFLVRARFDQQKDIPYAIRLMDNLVHQQGRDDFRFFVNGYGPGKTMIENLIDYYNLQDHVFMNERDPDNYIYLSTARLETLGYSIAEEFDIGHAVVAYPGDDGVVRENFQNFQNCLWITKNIEDDAQQVIQFADQQNSLEGYKANIRRLSEYTDNYVKYFEENTAIVSEADKPDKQVNLDKMLDKIETTSLADELTKYRKIYYKLKKVPVIGSILNNAGIKSTGMKILSVLTGKKSAKADEGISVDPNKFFVESFHGSNFSGDPKYLALAVKKRLPNAEIFVSCENQLVANVASDYGFKPVRINTLAYMQAFKKCKYVFINGNSLDKVGKQPGQIFVETWHGFPMKKMVNDLENFKQRHEESTAFAPRMLKWDYLLSSSSYNTELLESAFALKKNHELKVLEYGTPKNGFLIKNKVNSRERAAIYQKYFNKQYDPDKRIVLFCPTWRKDERDSVSDLDLRQVIHQLPENYELIVKLHPLEGRLRPYYKDLDERIFCFYNELVDIQELYILADVLISDYSSAMFDYSNLNKPIIVMQEDEENYQQNIGWYFNIEQTCHLTAHKYTTDQLVEEILRTTTQEVNMDYNGLIKEKLLTNENADAAEKILDKILVK
ncbi:glycosyl transferase family 1 [Ligilactobacillus salitolerans]|uniref:Glycosyl transferase family 1 n=1 Tax=Ligilactobacillus salitolerans TaxID=1808352 RepID=A0A401IW34_9LACO|nr:CDP-glycerol glycerophosphotransferase family protein [Ligilactobacillus salitolerans]GBG95763.1 glycosyl transferase family 1 [Ligilactobacillus salitolerans]